MQFSIIMPVYNVEKYLPPCLTSIERQTCQDFELIMVDDGSTDKSGIICDQYAKLHVNTVVIHKDNEGALIARLTGIERATGDYLVFCDSDDTIAINTLEELQRIIRMDNPDMVMYGYNIVDDQGNELEDHYHTFDDEKRFDKGNKEQLLEELSTTAWLNNMVTKATRTSIVKRDGTDYTKYRNLKMGEDLFQVVSMIENCETFVYIAQPLYHYRRNPTGMSKSLKDEYLENYMTISEKVWQMLEKEKVCQEVFIRYYNRYILDVYKYLLRFLKKGITRSSYEDKYNLVINHTVYKKAFRYKKSWSKTNRLLSIIVKPESKLVGTFFSRTVFNKKLILR